MSTEVRFDLDPSIKREFGTLAGDPRVTRTAAALESNGISVLRAADAAEAKRVVLGLIPDGSQVHHGASQSLDVTGITDEIEKSGRYEPVRLPIEAASSEPVSVTAWMLPSITSGAADRRRMSSA